MHRAEKSSQRNKICHPLRQGQKSLYLFLGFFYSSPLSEFGKLDCTNKDLKHGSQDLLHGKNVLRPDSSKGTEIKVSTLFAFQNKYSNQNRLQLGRALHNHSCLIKNMKTK